MAEIVIDGTRGTGQPVTALLFLRELLWSWRHVRSDSLRGNTLRISGAAYLIAHDLPVPEPRVRGGQDTAFPFLPRVPFDRPVRGPRQALSALSTNGVSIHSSLLARFGGGAAGTTSLIRDRPVALAPRDLLYDVVRLDGPGRASTIKQNPESRLIYRQGVRGQDLASTVFPDQAVLALRAALHQWEQRTLSVQEVKLTVLPVGQVYDPFDPCGGSQGFFPSSLPPDRPGYRTPDAATKKRLKSLALADAYDPLCHLALGWEPPEPAIRDYTAEYVQEFGRRMRDLGLDRDTWPVPLLASRLMIRVRTGTAARMRSRADDSWIVAYGNLCGNSLPSILVGGTKDLPILSVSESFPAEYDPARTLWLHQMPYTGRLESGSVPNPPPMATANDMARAHAVPARIRTGTQDERAVFFFDRLRRVTAALFPGEDPAVSDPLYPVTRSGSDVNAYCNLSLGHIMRHVADNGGIWLTADASARASEDFLDDLTDGERLVCAFPLPWRRPGDDLVGPLWLRRDDLLRALDLDADGLRVLARLAEAIGWGGSDATARSSIGGFTSVAALKNQATKIADCLVPIYTDDPVTIAYRPASVNDSSGFRQVTLQPCRPPTDAPASVDGIAFNRAGLSMDERSSRDRTDARAAERVRNWLTRTRQLYGYSVSSDERAPVALLFAVPDLTDEARIAWQNQEPSSLEKASEIARRVVAQATAPTLAQLDVPPLVGPIGRRGQREGESV